MRLLFSLASSSAAAAGMSSRLPHAGRSFKGRGFSQQWGNGDQGFAGADSQCRRGESGAGKGFNNGGGGFFQQRARLPPAERREDHRSWRFAVPRPPSSWERFTVVSYNILADYLAKDHRRRLYYHIPHHILNWEWRKKSIFFELGLWNPDVMCFQEVDQFDDLEKELKLHDYKGVWKRRTGVPIDGCAIFWRCSRFNLLHEESIEFKEFGLKDNVAQLCVLECKNQTAFTENGSFLPISSKHSERGNVVVVCNTHVLYNPNRGDIKLGQVRILLDRAHKISRTWNDAPVVVCGDFNCTPKSPLYNFISQQKLDISCLAKNEVSGQSSGCINWRELSLQGSQLPPINSTWSVTAANGENNYDHANSFKEMDNYRNNGLLRGGDSPFNSVARGIKIGLSFDADSGSSSSAINSLVSSLGEKGDMAGFEDSNQSLPVDVQNDGLNFSESTVVERPESASGPSPVIKSLCSNYVDLAVERIVDDQVGGGGGGGGDDEGSNIKIEGRAKEWETISNLISSVQNARTLQDHTDKDDICVNTLKTEGVNDAKASFSNLSNYSVDSGPTEKMTESIERSSYNPYVWKPEEILAASGNVESLSAEHSLKLKSTYAQVEDYAGTKDASREPQVTSYNRHFMGTVDYIWCSEALQTVKVLDIIPKHVLLKTPGYPTRKWGSDHLALACELAFVKNVPTGEV